MNSDKPSITLPEIQARLAQSGGKRLWRSLEEIAGTPEYESFLHNEFPNDPAKDPAIPDHGSSRRDVLKLMAASAALAGLTSCTKLPTEKIFPYVRAPEEIIPGKPLYYATSMPREGMAMGLLVESHMGRPTKVEGNPDHPASLGSTDIFAQASVLTLYDPDRSRVVLHEGRISDWNTLLAAMSSLRDEAKSDHGAGLRILTGAISSPSLAAQLRNLLEQFPEVKWHVHEPCGTFSTLQGARLAFGKNLNPIYRFDQAAVVVSLDSDFLCSGPTNVRYARDFATRRNVENLQSPMNRLYVAESTPTNTGAMADHRWAIRCGEIQNLARTLGAALGLPVQTGASPVRSDWVNALVRDLQKNRGSSIVLAGESQPPYVHALACAMNQALGNFGKTVIYTEPLELSSPADSLPELARDIDAGQVKTLIILGANPAFTAPANLDFARRILSVKQRFHLGLYNDETAELCQEHIPETHYLESWSDARAHDGTVGIVQPLIAPLYQDAKSAHEILGILTGDLETTPHDFVHGYWEAQHISQHMEFEAFWETTLHDGVMAGTALSPIDPKLTLDYAQLPPPAQTAKESLEIVFRPDPTIGDGRWANSGWLQELPKPLTKLTWDNALMLSPMTAWNSGVTNGDVVDLDVKGWKAAGPVWIMPGHADGSATLHLGYGRRRAGHVGTGFGLNGYLLRTSAALQFSDGLTVQKTGRTYLMANTQMHHAIDRDGQQLEEESVNAFERGLVRIATFEEFQKDPNFAAEKDKENVAGLSLYAPYKYDGYAWGMSIDLNRCTGCSACVVACYAENNIAVVGKYEVMAGRDMQWIRIDNYYRGSLENPEMYFEPVPCMHCEQAPCELVCPVGATAHSSEGLNEMIYNRCVGTRYCSNNCPYKVRRFNFKLYSDWNTPSLYGLRNPNVTVRSRGVMEKCSYCVQRVNAAKIQSEEEDRTIRDGEIKTACQQVCPAEAIVFGNINDPGTRVSKLKASSRNYGLLEELNTRPRTTYLGKLRNPNPEITGT